MDNEMEASDHSTIRITEYFANKDIFITGSTGIVGKVLVEKLLRSCPDLKNLYLLLRPKKKQTVYDRLAELKSSMVFDRLKHENPLQLNKLKIISGDITEIGLGISTNDIEKLQNVSIVYHIAACIRFDDPVKNSIIMNVRGTRETLRLAEKLPKLEVFLHTSTSYSNPKRRIVDEIIYPETFCWKKAITLAETMDENKFNAVSEKFIDWYPNTYTFTKGLAEHCVMSFKDRLPIIIYRPSIVISALEEPYVGWFDAFVGPIGLLPAINTGICRTIYSRDSQVLDFIPVDVVAQGLIVCVWERAIFQQKINPPNIYNCSSTSRRCVELDNALDRQQIYVPEYPYTKMLWLPNGQTTSYWSLYILKVIFLQVFIATILDGIAIICRHKPLFVKLQRRLFAAQNANRFFTFKRYNFKNENFLSLQKKLHPLDYPAFNYMKNFDMELDVLLKRLVIGARRYLLKESDDSLDRARKVYKSIYVVDKIFKILFAYLLFNCFVQKMVFGLFSN